MSADGLQEILDALGVWQQRLHETPVIPWLGSEQRPPSMNQTLESVLRRIADGPCAPVRIAFFGATGAGKSKVFSSLIGRAVSPSGFRRPFTKRACYFVHDDWAGLARKLAGSVEFHHEDEWQSGILIDTPDFDSIDVANRAEADRVLRETDAFVFVTDSLKYADASTWDYLRRILQSGKSLHVVLNKCNSDTVRESFQERMQACLASFPASRESQIPLTTLPEFPIDDETLIPSDDPHLQELRAAVKELASGQGLTSRTRLLSMDLTQLFDLSEVGLREAEACLAEKSRLQAQMAERLTESTLRLEQRLTVSIDDSARNAVYERVLSRIEKLDILRYPRRILSFPARAVRQLLSGWWQGGTSQREAPLEASEMSDPVTAETFQMLEAELLQFANHVRIDLLAEPRLEPLLTRDRFRELRFTHDELAARFSEENDHFRKWVADHAQETAAQITGENKAKFFLSQLLFNSVLLTAQVHTGGLSLMELGLDSVVSPAMAKGMGMLIGKEKVAQFEAAAKEEHQRLLARILTASHDRFRDFLDASAHGLEDFAELLREISGSARHKESLVAAFEQNALGLREPLAAPVTRGPLP